MTETSSFLPPWKIRGLWKSTREPPRCGRADKWRQWRRRYLSSTPQHATAQCHLDARQRIRRGKKKKKHSLEFLKRGLRFFLWIIHCNLWNIIRSVCGCNWFVYENSHCSEKCQRQPNHRADSSGSHCSVNAASAAPPSKTKPRLKANSATTVHAGNHSSCCSHRLKAGWFSVISLQRTPELVKPLTVQLSWTIRHVSSSRSVWVDTWRRRFEAEEPDGWGKQIYRLQQTRQLSSATGQMWKRSFHQRVPPLGGFPSGSIINHGGETLSRKPHFNKERQKEARWK